MILLESLLNAWSHPSGWWENMNDSWAHVSSENYLVNSSATIILSAEIVLCLAMGRFTLCTQVGI